jgi:hypothetical protein
VPSIDGLASTLLTLRAISADRIGGHTELHSSGVRTGRAYCTRFIIACFKCWSTFISDTQPPACPACLPAYVPPHGPHLQGYSKVDRVHTCLRLSVHWTLATSGKMSQMRRTAVRIPCDNRHHLPGCGERHVYVGCDEGVSVG